MSAPFVDEMKELLRAELDLAGPIDADTPLFGGGSEHPDALGLDSLDALQIAVAVEERFGVRLPEGDDARPVYRSCLLYTSDAADE